MKEIWKECGLQQKKKKMSWGCTWFYVNESSKIVVVYENYITTTSHYFQDFCSETLNWVCGCCGPGRGWLEISLVWHLGGPLLHPQGSRPWLWPLAHWCLKATWANNSLGGPNSLLFQKVGLYSKTHMTCLVISTTFFLQHCVKWFWTTDAVEEKSA